VVPVDVVESGADLPDVAFTLGLVEDKVGPESCVAIGHNFCAAGVGDFFKPISCGAAVRNLRPIYALNPTDCVTRHIFHRQEQSYF
jgi:hypothetical protein